MVIIEREEASEQGYLKTLMTIPCGFGGIKQDKDAPNASVVVVLDVMDPQDRLYCLEMGPAQLLNTFQRLPTLGLLPLATDLPGRMPIEIYTPKFGRITYCLSFRFKSNYFSLCSW
jgi:hypothetical protein